MTTRSASPSAHVAQEPRGFDDFEMKLGDIMRGERATLGKSLLDVQRDLKIKAAYIAAIENCDPSAFETQGFVAGYVRSYARYLGMSPEETFEAFCRESGFSTAHGMSAQASTRMSQPKAAGPVTAGGDPFTNPGAPYLPQGASWMSEIEPRAIASVAVLLALIGGIGFGAWSVLQEIQRVGVAPVDQTPGVASSVTAIDPVAGISAVAEGPQIALGDAPTAPPAPDRLYRPQALDLPVMAARDGPIGAVDPNKIGALVAMANPPSIDSAAPDGPAPAANSEMSPATAPDPTQEVKVVAEAPPQVVVLAVRPAWVRVKAADGTVLFEKILDAGERYTVPTSEEPAQLRAGNSGAVYLAIGNKTYGPVGSSAAVAKNIGLGPQQVLDHYQIADLNSDPALKKYAEAAQAESQ